MRTLVGVLIIDVFVLIRLPGFESMLGSRNISNPLGDVGVKFACWLTSTLVGVEVTYERG